MRKQYMNYMKSYLLVMVARLVSMVGAAQSLSPAAVGQLKTRRLWPHSQNATGVPFDDIQNYSNVILGYDLQDGDYCRPQEEQKEAIIGVSSEDFINLENVYVWGVSNFAQKSLTDAGYDASIAGPFRGMPYYVVDQHLSKQRNQYYDLKFRAATPLLGNRWALGLKGNYVAALAAEQCDPRMNTRFYILGLTPRIIYKLDNSRKFDTSFKYSSIKKDSKMSNVNSYVDQGYYILYGLGTVIKGIGNGVTSSYIGDRFGEAFQHNFSMPSFNLLLEGSYNVEAETVRQSYTTPRKITGVRDKTAHVSLTMIQGGKDYTSYVRTTYTNRNISNIQYISQRDNFESQSGWVELHNNIHSTYKA